MRVFGSLAVLAGAAALLAACGGKPEETAPAAESAAVAPAPAPPTAEETQKLLASLPAPYNTADVENGRKKFGLCRSCHSLAEGGPNMTGPHLYGVFGRKAASVEGFNYSDALKASGIVWEAAKLDPWLESPKALVPGTKMAFMGVKDPKDRTDLIAYLMTQTGYKPAT